MSAMNWNFHRNLHLIYNGTIYSKYIFEHIIVFTTVDLSHYIKTTFDWLNVCLSLSMVFNLIAKIFLISKQLMMNGSRVFEMITHKFSFWDFSLKIKCLISERSIRIQIHYIEWNVVFKAPWLLLQINCDSLNACKRILFSSFFCLYRIGSIYVNDNHELWK